jgi:methylmalonyl-CoA carboxyltransferase large subunit
MATTNVKTDSLLEAVESLRAEVGRLGSRIAALEAIAGKPPIEAKVPPSPVVGEAVSEELMLVIGAAVAAYLGVKPHIRQIHLLNNVTWAQQGRVTIQASHTLALHHS